MSTTRLTFLYPHLFRSIRAREPAAQAARGRARAPRPQCQPTQNFATSGRRERHRAVERHGTAVEPYPLSGGSAEPGEPITPGPEGKDAEESKDSKTEAKEIKDTKVNKKAAKEKEKPKDTELNPSSAAPLSEETQAAAILPGEGGAGDASRRESEVNRTGPTPLQQAAANLSDSLAPLETVLQMPPPESLHEEDAAKPPHLRTPPNFVNQRSITAMKAVRGLLAVNLDMAKASLVSKSDVDNETYLFRAACSELRTEIQNHRKVNEEATHRDRTLLQHEVDILNQKLTQELLTLKDDLKGMFDDRKMAVRMEQRAMESKIQELNYKITVALNSDSKSEVEGLRWVLTRRSVMGILFMAVMVLTSLRYASYKSHEESIKKRKEPSPRLEDIIVGSPAQGAAEILAAN